MDSQQPSTSRPLRPRALNLSDPATPSIIEEWLLNEDDCDFSDSSDVDENFVMEVIDSRSDSECSLSDTELEMAQDNFEDLESGADSSAADATQSRSSYYYGKNKFKWSKQEPTRNVRIQRHNIIKPEKVVLPVNDKTPVSLFKLLFDDQMISVCLKWTNVKLTEIKLKFKNQSRPELKEISQTEFEAFIGLLLYTSAFKSNHEDITLLFATDGSGRDIFRAVMSRERFAIILRSLRFDDFSTRSERSYENPLSAISEIFDHFIENCQKNYRLSPYVCIDEMLIGFRGRCKFVVYMPNKPDKYGLKLLCLVDATNGYLYNAYIYHGKDSDGIGLQQNEKNLLKPTQSVIRLVKQIINTNRNVTADNWFSSIELTKELLKRGLTYCGTLRKNKAEIPPQFTNLKSREEGSCLYGFTKDVTLLSRITKKNKAVILVSSMHHSIGIDETNGLPEINSFYNATKGGVDALDEKCSKMTCKRRSRRWPCTIFYRILDIASANAYVISGQAYKRSEFIKQVAKGLVLKHLESRLTNPYITESTKITISQILNKPRQIQNVNPESDKLTKRKYCSVCDYKKKRKTQYVCTFCKNPICLSCSKLACVNCIPKN